MMVPPTGSTPIVTSGYQMHIKKTSVLDKETEDRIEAITKSISYLLKKSKKTNGYFQKTLAS